MAGITKWFWVTIEGYLSYLLPKFEDLVPTSLDSGAIQTHRKCVIVTADYCDMEDEKGRRRINAAYLNDNEEEDRRGGRGDGEDCGGGIDSHLEFLLLLLLLLLLFTQNCFCHFSSSRHDFWHLANKGSVTHSLKRWSHFLGAQIDISDLEREDGFDSQNMYDLRSYNVIL